MTYDRIIAVDWSARSKPSPKSPTKDAIFMCEAGGHPTYHRTRADAMQAIDKMLEDALANDQCVLLGCDFNFGYPAGFAQALTGASDGLAVWEWLEAHIEDEANNANNRFDVAKKMNRMFAGSGPFWGCPSAVADSDLPAKGSLRHGHGMTERRTIETVIPRAQSTWKLFTTGSVGSQSLLGLPYLWRLKQKYGDDLNVWPLETGFAQPDAKITLVEIYPSIASMKWFIPLETRYPNRHYSILDAEQVKSVCEGYKLADEVGVLERAFTVKSSETNANMISQEGWILGVGVSP